MRYVCFCEKKTEITVEDACNVMALCFTLEKERKKELLERETVKIAVVKPATYQNMSGGISVFSACLVSL